MTLNLQGFTDWEERKPRILAYIARAAPDMLLFQEVVYLPGISPYNQVQVLNKTLGYPYEHCAVTRLQNSTEHSVYREGLAILSKHPIAATDVVVLKQAAGDEHQRIVQLANIVIDDAIIKIANVHFSLSDPLPDYASAHIQELFEILESRNEQRIIAGDFNLDNPEKPAAAWADHYKTSIATTPYISQINAVVEEGIRDRHTDHIWIPRDYVFAGDIATSTDSLSDHRAVSATIIVNQSTKQ